MAKQGIESVGILVNYPKADGKDDVSGFVFKIDLTQPFNSLKSKIKKNYKRRLVDGKFEIFWRDDSQNEVKITKNEDVRHAIRKFSGRPLHLFVKDTVKNEEQENAIASVSGAMGLLNVNDMDDQGHQDRRHQGPLKGRTALVTGSTSGIGEGIARGLAEKGANIILNGFGDMNLIEKLKQDLEKAYGVKVVFIDADLTKQEDVAALHQSCMEAFPNGVDILVNNAGFQHVSPVEDFSVEIWNKMMAVMLTAPFHLIKLCVGNMKRKGWGRIINIASAHGHVASPNKTAYVSAKHGIIGLTKTVGLETAGTGVTCNAVCPGYVETELFIKQAEDRAKAQSISVEEGKKQILKVHPSGEPIKIKEVADIVTFLCSPATNQMTGSSLTVDGGWTCN